MRGVTFSNFAAKKFDSQKVDHGPTLSPRIFIRFARKNSPSGNQPLRSLTFICAGDGVQVMSVTHIQSYKRCFYAKTNQFLCFDVDT